MSPKLCCRRLPGAVSLATLSIGTIFANATFATVSYTKVADETTTIPSGIWAGQNFRAFTYYVNLVGAPAIDQGNTVFVGTAAANFDNGVFTWSAADGLKRLADPSTALPGGGSSSGFFRTSVNGGEFAFSTDVSIYRTVGATLTVVLAPGEFAAATGTSLDGDSVWFMAHQGDQHTLYRWTNGSTIPVVQKGQPTPGSPGYSFTGLDSDTPGGQGNVAFFASSGQTPFGFSREGIYKYVGGTFERVADNQMIAPGTGVPFNNFDNFPIAYDGQTLAFVGDDSLRGRALYVQRATGELQAVAVDGQAAPGGGLYKTSFESFDVATDNDHIAFASDLSTGGRAIFTDYGGPLQRILRTGDTLFGQTISGLEMGGEGLSGGQIAFWASFTNGNSGIFIANVPEPATATVCVAAAAAILSGAPQLRRSGRVPR